MKRYWIILFCIFAVAKGFGQTAGKNYVMTETMLNNTGTRSIRSVQYYDGIGRPSLHAENGAGPGGKYVYARQDYDLNGRESVRWLPSVGGTTPSYIDSASVVIQSANTYNDYSAYSFTQYDALNRPIALSTPGDDWEGHGKEIRYITNDTDDVKHYYTNFLASFTVQLDGYYPAGSLTGVVTADEDGHELITYKDMHGRVVLERRDGDNDTYFVYTHTGLLRFVLTPKYQENALSSLMYEYRYDTHGRCIRKTLPGSSYVQYWYDSGDRLKFMQDGELRTHSRYRFYIYDRLGRVVLQGLCDGGDQSESVCPVITSYNPLSGLLYTGYVVSSALSLVNPEIEIVRYFDHYGFLSSPAFLAAAGSRDFTRPSPVNAHSLLTGEVVRASNGELLARAYYYDEKGQVIDQRETFLNKDYIKTTRALSFTGNVETQTEVLTKGNLNVTVTRTSTYDNTTATLSGETFSYGGQSVQAAGYSYDNLGRVSTKYHQSEQLITNYTYDLHGWPKVVESRLVGQSAPWFYEHLNYASGTNPCYNGNISSMVYITSNDGQMHGYLFSYDGMNRLTDATHCLYNLTPSPTVYSESGIQYDRNGNIKRLVRTGYTSAGTAGEIDRMRYNSYTGNQLVAIRDSAGSNVLYSGGFEFHQVNGYKTTQYAYNSNGAMKYDRNKGIGLVNYDLTGNPRRVQFENGHVIEYDYSADGCRLRTVWRTAVNGVSVTYNTSHVLTAAETLSVDSIDNVGHFQFKNGMFLRYLFEDGYVTVGSATQLHYFIRDHQGNNRMVIRSAGTSPQSTLSVEQTTHYYPYGGLWGDVSSSQNVQPYKYNGKELDRMHGLDLYDYGARQYDPTTARFTSIDPLCEKYYHISPYAYCAGNPVNYVDPDGKRIEIAQGVSVEFKEQLNLALKYMDLKGTIDIIRQIDKLPQVIYINALPEELIQKGRGSFFNSSLNTIFWDPFGGIITDNGFFLSPATVLNHEADHALRELTDPIQKKKDLMRIDVQYGNAEERRVIEGSEQRTAYKHGEIEEGEITRNNHNGYRYEMNSSITTVGVLEW